jgi:hypothetical protein
VVDISGSRVSLRGVDATGATAQAEGWNGDLAVLHGALDLSDTPGVDAFVQMRADDANPILALTVGSSLPGFVVGALKAPELSGQARIVLEHDRAAILGAHLRGGNVVLIGDYAARPEHVRAAFIVAKGAFSAGVKLDDEGTTVRLFGLESWREEEKPAVLALFATAPPTAPTSNANAKTPPPAR